MAANAATVTRTDAAAATGLKTTRAGTDKEDGNDAVGIASIVPKAGMSIRKTPTLEPAAAVTPEAAGIETRTDWICAAAGEVPSATERKRAAVRRRSIKVGFRAGPPP